MKDAAEADALFSALPRKAKVSGEGANQVLQGEVRESGQDEVAEVPLVFSVEETRLVGLVKRKVGA